jgi:hypothetical protein
MGVVMKKLFGITPLLFALSVCAGDFAVVCESMTPCRAPPFTIESYEVPALAFDTTDATPITTAALVWWSAGCPGDADAVYGGDGFVPGAGHWYLEADIGKDPSFVDYSIQWTIDGCPTLDCVDGTIGSAPEECKF